MTPLNAGGSEATTPTRALGHGSASTRGLESTASSSLAQSRFGYPPRASWLQEGLDLPGEPSEGRAVEAAA